LQFAVQAHPVGRAERTEVMVGVRTSQDRYASRVHRFHRGQGGVEVADRNIPG
jgi:hypothetical protein